MILKKQERFHLGKRYICGEIIHLLDIVIIEGRAILHWSASVHKLLLIRWDPFHGLQASLDGFDFIIWTAFHSNSVPCQSLDVDFDRILGFG